MEREEFWREVQRALGVSEDGIPGPETDGALREATSVEILFRYETPELIVINGEPPWIRIARGYIGIQEIPGIENNPQVLKWWKLIRLNYQNDEIPWCAAYVGGVLEEAGIESTRSGRARSYESWGQACKPTLGAIAVFRREGGGHVGFVIGVDASGNLMILGGNQGDAVRISSFPRANLITTRWPKGYAVPEDAPLPQL